MSVQTQNERLAALTAQGTAVWLDQIRRSITEGGELQRLVDEMSLRGETSNPAIFEKAILGSEDYDEQIERLAKGGADARAIYQAIATEDVAAAADVLRPVYDELGGLDGFVSLEVDPDLAFDTDRTIEQAVEYWNRVDRPNLMIKIPGTDEGTPAIEEAIYRGINVNVTLLFSVAAYAAIAEAYIKGLERRHAEGLSLDVRSVASFFVSRVDTETDKRLEKLGADKDLFGKAGLANARAAYVKYQEIFEGERFAALREAGAAVQRPLWASTGVKNPDYPDTMYVDGLVGPETVNTMPMDTLLAAADHAEITGPTVLEDPAPVLAALKDAGIDLGDVTDTLLQAGVDAFVTPMEKLLAGIDAKRSAIHTGRPESIGARMSAELEDRIAETVRRAADEKVAARIWDKDPTLWGPADQPEVANRLGWLDAVEVGRAEADGLRAFAEQAASDGFTDALLLGMGGSSLAPEVLRQSFGAAEGALTLHVLDSTDAGTVNGFAAALDLEKTLFIVSTKSGGTIETRSLFEHFWKLRPEGSQFVAITDPGSGLVDLADEHGFRHTFLNDPDVGGRYSALTLFGLVPAALAGVDLDVLLDSAAGVAEECRAEGPNPGVWLGSALGALARNGRDKATFVIDESLASYGLWVEQLIAESTGKHGTGILPVADEPVGKPAVYGDDRVIVHLTEEGDEAVDALAHAGVPVITLKVCGPQDLGSAFFLAEFATAVAGWALEINPFDQPDVQRAKDATNKVLADGIGSLPDADDAELKTLLQHGSPPDYVALLGFVGMDPGVDAAIAELRTAIRDTQRTTTTFGYGPRYLHSTGQLHKGGPTTGRFIVLVHDTADDADIPGQEFGFTTLKNAQAAGDLATLQSTGRPVAFVRLKGDSPAAAVQALTDRIKGLIQ